MSILRVATIEPEGATTTLTLGLSGDTVTSNADSIKANTFKDAGGNTLWTSDGSGTLSSISSGIPTSGPKLILSQTASGDSSLSFTSGLTSTYDKYMFVFVNINAATTGAQLQFQVSSDGGSNYNKTITSTFYRSKHFEDDSGTAFNYEAGMDQAQGTSYQTISNTLYNAADASTSGTMLLFAPANTVQVKNWYARFSAMCYDVSVKEYVQELDAAGFVNETVALNAIDFKMDTGTFDGKITMYGVT